jgi:glycosyltransferase involved in cell wall biosynthesis
MTAPQVTVVIATRDRPRMLREALDTVLDQDYEGDIETVVVFDQSPPDTTLEDLGRPGRTVRVTTNDRLPGLAGSRNTGIALGGGDLIAFCDDDDLWLPGKLQRQVTSLQGRDAAMATCGILVEYDGEEHVRRLEISEVDFAELLRDRHTELHPSTFLVSRELLDRMGGVSEEVPGGFGEDYEFLLRAAKVGTIINVVEPLVRVRWGKQSFFFRRWETMAEGLTWLLDAYPDFETQPKGAARVHGQVAFAHAALGERKVAMRWAGSAIRRNPLEPRAYLAAAVAGRLVSPHTVMERLHKIGRGI